MTDSPSTLQTAKYHHNHNESEERHMWSENLREMTQSASSPLVYRVGTATVSSGAWQWEQSRVFPDIACNPSGTSILIHIHAHPLLLQLPHLWQEISTQLDWVHRMCLFFASLNCSFPQAMCFLYISAQKSFNRKRSSQRVLQQKAQEWATKACCFCFMECSHNSSSPTPYNIQVFMVYFVKSSL